jgi:hypothetical protein
MTTSTPDQLPLLGAGAHLHPSDGACLMEYVSVLAGENFSDHPRCTDPLLAHLARMVNDATSDAARPLLARFAPDLAAAGRGGPRVAPVVVGATLAAAAASRPGNRSLRRHLRRTVRRLERFAMAESDSGEALRDAVYRRGAAPRGLAVAAASVIGLPQVERDAALATLLNAALQAHTRATQGSTTSPVGVPAVSDVASVDRPGERLSR